MSTGEITVILGLMILLLLMFVGLMVALLSRIRPPANPYYGYQPPPYDVPPMPWRTRQATEPPPPYSGNSNGCLEILIYMGVVLSFFTTVGFLVFLSRLLNTV